MGCFLPSKGYVAAGWSVRLRLAGAQCMDRVKPVGVIEVMSDWNVDSVKNTHHQTGLECGALI